jgi:hypothetical protein
VVTDIRRLFVLVASAAWQPAQFAGKAAAYGTGRPSFGCNSNHCEPLQRRRE